MAGHTVDTSLRAVGFPRFYIDHGYWLYKTGYQDYEDKYLSLLGLNPTNQKDVDIIEYLLNNSLCFS